MSILPPPPVLAAVLALLLLPAALVALGHGAWRIDRLGVRFRLAAGAGALLWIALTGFWGGFGPGWGTRWGDLAAGLLILATGIWAAFCAWSLLAWSFTISMLITLVDAERPLDAEAWIGGFAGSRGLDAFMHDRLALLFALGVARRAGNVVTVTSPRGLLVARIANCTARMFGLGR